MHKNDNFLQNPELKDEYFPKKPFYKWKKKKRNY